MTLAILTPMGKKVMVPAVQFPPITVYGAMGAGLAVGVTLVVGAAVVNVTVVVWAVVTVITLVVATVVVTVTVLGRADVDAVTLVGEADVDCVTLVGGTDVDCVTLVGRADVDAVTLVGGADVVANVILVSKACPLSSQLWSDVTGFWGGWAVRVAIGAYELPAAPWSKSTIVHLHCIRTGNFNRCTCLPGAISIMGPGLVSCMVCTHPFLGQNLCTSVRAQGCLSVTVQPLTSM
jgi:hypothetical protein